MKREVCFDTETTGLKTEEGHRIVEIGCIELMDNVRTNNYYHVYLNPERDIPIESTNIHGLTIDFLKDKPKFYEIKDEFLKFIGDSILVAHNANFDIKFVNYELQLCGVENITNEVIDSLKIAKQKFPGQKNNLDALCKRFNVDSSRRTLHGALLDAELLADVYIELNGGAQQSFDTKTENKTEKEKNTMEFEEFIEMIKNNIKLTSRNFKLSEEEKEKHKEFINNKIKNNLWYK